MSSIIDNLCDIIDLNMHTITEEENDCIEYGFYEKCNRFCIYYLTAWGRDQLEKLIVTELIKKFPAFYGTRRFITVFTGPF